MNNKGLSLIIVIFALMLFAVLAWSLAAMLGGHFDAGLRGLQSEQALYTAEAGVYWARNQIANNSNWRTSADTDCSDAGDWVYHSFGSGQYGVCCRSVTAAESAQGTVVAEVRGFMPSQANYKARRELRFYVSPSTFDQVVQTNGGVFNWTGVDEQSKFNDDLIMSSYEGDGDAVHNEPGIDYRSTAPVLPWGNAVYQRAVGEKDFPVINMAYFESEAAGRSQVWEPPMTAKIVSVTALGSNLYELQLDKNIFSAPYSQYTLNGNPLLRNITRGTFVSVSTGAVITSVSAENRVTVQQPGLSWLAGERVSVVPLILNVLHPSTYVYQITLNFAYFRGFTTAVFEDDAVRNLAPVRGTWGYFDWGAITALTDTTVTIRLDSSLSAGQIASNLWLIGQPVCVCKRYINDDNNRHGDLQRKTLWFLGSDVLFDTNEGSVIGRQTSIVAEGDIVIRGSERIYFTERPYIYPNLATKNGAIWSPDEPDGSSRAARLRNRDFDDVVYSENGPVLFNCLDARAVFGASVTLTGDVRMKFDEDVPRVQGFTWDIPQAKWTEQ